ncbi:hypothetical protein Acy02nite_91090 [Actinoplanes cyaneus]|uniref:Uncharacterized protein n=1 Tax=Actinoplanes cyaneus TaxID=52696 RepID=A0A919MB57_9ACTN|nr:hypothetical protein Acy02nite_91090 [Actinoplanes cyaneus]
MSGRTQQEGHPINHHVADTTTPVRRPKVSLAATLPPPAPPASKHRTPEPPDQDTTRRPITTRSTPSEAMHHGPQQLNNTKIDLDNHQRMQVSAPPGVTSQQAKR